MSIFTAYANKSGEDFPLPLCSGADQPDTPFLVPPAVPSDDLTV